MSVRCEQCGAVASYGKELGHKSDCPSLRKKRRYVILSAGPDHGALVRALEKIRDDMLCDPKQVAIDALDAVSSPGEPNG